MRILTLAVLLCNAVLSLSGADLDPFIGKWKLNWDKSKTSDPAPKSVIRSYSPVGKGVTVDEVWTKADGMVVRTHYTANYDGKEYASDTPSGVTISFKRKDRYMVVGESKLNGKLEYRFTRSVSNDGKVLTIEMDEPNNKRTLVYDRIDH